MEESTLSVLSDTENIDANESLSFKKVEPVKEELIKINLPVFESYLNSIKDQLVKHEKQLESPAWLDDLKAESDKIVALARRLEHTQLDVNTIKDFIYYPPSNGSKEKQRKDPMLLLQADVESLKLVTRRIDLYQSEDLNVYMQLKKLQKDYYDLLKMIEKLDKDSVINAMKIDFNNKIADMSSRIGEMSEIVEENQHVLNDRIDEVHSAVDTEIKEKIKDVQEQINAFLSDGEEEEEEEVEGKERDDGSDNDPRETEDAFNVNTTIESAAILKPSQMVSPASSPASGSKKSVLLSSPNSKNDNISMSGAIGLSSSSPSTKDRKNVKTSEDTEESEEDVVSPNSKRRNTISNAMPGRSSESTVTSSAVKEVPTASPNKGGGRTTTFGVIPPKPRSTTFSTTEGSTADGNAGVGRGTVTTLTDGGAAGMRRSTQKGGKFCTLERFHALQDEVDYLKSLLSNNIYKLRAYGVSRLQKVFSRLVGKEALFQKKRAISKFKLNCHLINEHVQKKYREFTVKAEFIIDRAAGRQKVKDYFIQWKAVNARLKVGRRLFHYSHGIMKYWVERVHIDIRKYLNIWKNFTVESFRRFIYVGLEDNEAPAYDEFQHLLNGNFNMKAMRKIAHKDLLRRMSMREAKLAQCLPQITYMKDVEAEEKMNNTITELTKRLEESEEEAKVMRRDVLRLYALFEGQKQDMTARIDREALQIIGNINNFKSKVTTQLTHTSDLIELNQKRSDTNFSLHADISEALRARIQGTERELEYHKETQHSIINSQKSIRVEMDELLVKQEYIDSKFKQVSNEIMLNARAMSVGIEEVRRVEKEYKDITSYYDSELLSIKANAKSIENNLAESIRNTDEKTDLLALKSDLLAANQDEVFPQKPQAYFVYKICLDFEKVMQRIHNEGGINLLNKSIEEELERISKEMAVEATRMAHYVVTAADRIVSHRLMETIVLQTAAPANLELDQKPIWYKMTPAMQLTALGANNGVHNNHNANVKNVPVSVQVAQQRETLLNDFLNQFVELLKEKEPLPGVVKANARIVFHSKLKLLTEVIISKSNCMFNLSDNFSGSLTKKPYNPVEGVGTGHVLGATLAETVSSETCVACNRPVSASLMKPPSGNNRPTSATRNLHDGGGNSNQETAATIAQLQQQLAKLTAAMSTLKFLDTDNGQQANTNNTFRSNNTTGCLRPQSATVQGSASMTGSTSMGGSGEIQKLKRSGTAHTAASLTIENGYKESHEKEELTMIDREHNTHLNTRRNSNSNVNFSLHESDFVPTERRSNQNDPTKLRSSLSRSPSPPHLSGSILENMSVSSLPFQQQMQSTQQSEPEFDYDGFHQYLDKPQQKKSLPTSTSAVRHREAVHKSHTMMMTNQGGGFKITPALSQEEMINTLTASFHADVSMPRDINEDRSDLLFTENENMIREIEQHALNNEAGLRSALMAGYTVSHDGNDQMTRGSSHHPSGMALSQSDSHLLGSRRLVSNNLKANKRFPTSGVYE